MTTPSKPDLVALADWLSGLAKPDSNIGVHLEAKERATIVSALRHLATQPSSYEAGLRDMRERAIAAQPCTAENPNEDSYQRGRFDGVIEYVRAIASLPADGGEVDYDTNDPMGVEKDIQSSDGGGQRKHENTLCSSEQQPESRPGPSEAPDKNCFTLPNGDCIGTGCMHDLSRSRDQRRHEQEAPGPSEATPSTAGSVREALGAARDAIQLTIDMRGVDGGGFLLSALNKADAALSAPVEAPVAVKSLEWDYDPGDFHYWRAVSSIGYFGISECGGRYRMCHPLGTAQSSTHETFEAAKAAAQRDHETRIRSALIATPRPLPSVEQITDLIRENCQVISDDERVCTEIDGIDEAATAILTLLGGSAHG